MIRGLCILLGIALLTIGALIWVDRDPFRDAPITVTVDDVLANRLPRTFGIRVDAAVDLSQSIPLNYGGNVVAPVVGGDGRLFAKVSPADQQGTPTHITGFIYPEMESRLPELQAVWDRKPIVIFMDNAGHAEWLRRRASWYFLGAGIAFAIPVLLMFVGAAVRKWQLRPRPLPVTHGNAVIDEQSLRHQGQTIPLEQIVGLRCLGSALQYTRLTTNGIEQGTINFDSSLARAVNQARACQRDLGRQASRKRAEWVRQELAQAGRQQELQSVSCPHCQAAITGSALSTAPQVYCAYCDSLTTQRSAGRRPAPADESSFRVCPACGLYARPRVVRVIYAVYVLVAIRWWRSETYCCNVCVREEAGKVFAFNVLTLLPLVYAVPLLWRAYFGGSAFSAAFRGLDTANGDAQRKDKAQALAGYEKILQRLQHAAGVRYNAALVYLQAGDAAAAQAHLTQALADCPNYVPAQELLGKLSQAR